MGKTRPMDLKVGVKPVFFQLIHSGTYKGPCRMGEKKNLDPEMERTRGEENFKRFQEELRRNLSPEARLLNPVKIEWKDNWLIPEKELKKIEADIEATDLFFISGDINVLMEMALLMYISRKSAYMGNSSIVNREENVIAVHHDVPG